MTSEVEVRKVGVVGCGLMGHGIAQIAAHPGGYAVRVVDEDADALSKGMRRIAGSLGKLADRAVQKGALPAAEAERTVAAALGRITPSARLEDLADCDLVIEAIVEDLGAKQALFARLATICRADAVLATNTSSLPVGEIAASVPEPARVIGLHFFNPVQLMGLVEVVRADATAEAAADAGRAFAERCGKTPIACRDTPGFVVNRLLVPLMVEALDLVDRGDATPDDVDTAMQLGAGHPMGPITLCDYVGLDTTLRILEGWVARYPDVPAFRVPRSLRAKVAEGKLGRKTGEGFYRWEGDKRL